MVHLNDCRSTRGLQGAPAGPEDPEDLRTHLKDLQDLKHPKDPVHQGVTRYNIRGTGMASRRCSRPQIQATTRSIPMPKPP